MLSKILSVFFAAIEIVLAFAIVCGILHVCVLLSAWIVFKLEDLSDYLHVHIAKFFGYEAFCHHYGGWHYRKIEKNGTS